MNREIKFELWDVKNKMMIRYEDEIGDDISMCPFTGSLYKDYALCFDNDREVEYIKRQFTGLKDKNGKEIYEGDILLPFNRKKGKEVIFDEGVFCIRNYDGYNSASLRVVVMDGVEVIGNIYENPELLK